MKKTAVVILNWNGTALMRRFLPSVVKHTGAGAEVIVADNGSTDESVRMLQEEFPTVRIVRLADNYGFAEGYNRALRQVDADFYVLLNSDVEVTAGWLEPLVRYMEAHPEAAACQPKLMSFGARQQFEYAGAAGGFIDRYGYPFCRGRVFETVETDHGQYDAPCPLFWATGACFMVRRTDWEQAGGFDGRFFAHMEEIDLCWRLRSRGRSIACVAESRVFHLGGGTLAHGNARKTFLNFRNNLLMLYKNLPEVELRPVMRVRLVLDWLAAAKFLLGGSREEARAVFRAWRAFRELRPEVEPLRRANLAAAVTGVIPERMRRSLLVAYYLRGQKTFSAIARGGWPPSQAGR